MLRAVVRSTHSHGAEKLMDPVYLYAKTIVYI